MSGARRLVLLGPPGAGKGTQAVRLCADLGLPQVSTGELFRRQKAEGTELGLLAASYMDRGEYVPDEVTDAVVERRLAETDARDGFLLDGYPRTLAQVEALDAMLRDSGHGLDLVLNITAPIEEVVDRLLGRAQQEGRADDTEEVIRRRLEVYEEETAPLVDVYRSRAILRDIDGLGDVYEVAARIRAVVDAG
mgnify:CR=1 FL=1